MSRYTDKIDFIVKIGKKEVGFANYQVELFWSKVNKNTENGCWEWDSWRSRKNYGLFRICRKFKTQTMFAHRVAFALTKGNLVVPEGLCVCHTCDNPCCVNPEHLWLGTNKENTDDRDNKGRHVPSYGDQNGSRKHPKKMRKGSAHGRAKLTEEQVIEIRRRYDAGGIYQYQLAKEYGVCQRLICVITRRENWKHI